ncbi:hypothetical protein Pcinc_016034 [Petrolisthes cinctipes]|uniref:Uncharacterized protein n=1 Tax=Petrolisthes cinctipes TaxID=88211 RepID=A0AAE1FRV6_PETCI|nr:hypothetical protein Pcinc_016034 [Petrolisthes cinctipes]
MGGIRGVVCSLGRAGVRRRGRCLALTAGFQSLLSAFTVNISLLFSSCCCFVICSSLANPALSGGCIEIWMTYLSEDNFCFNSGRGMYVCTVGYRNTYKMSLTELDRLYIDLLEMTRIWTGGRADRGGVGKTSREFKNAYQLTKRGRATAARPSHDAKSSRDRLKAGSKTNSTQHLGNPPPPYLSSRDPPPPQTYTAAS